MTIIEVITEEPQIIIEVITEQPLTPVEINSFRSVPVGINLTASGDGDSYLSDDGTYKPVSAGSAANLSIANKTGTTLDILSSSGTDVTLPEATTTEAGLFNAVDKVKLSGLATVATSGSYADLAGTPTIPAAQVNSDWNSVSGVSQILNKPTLGTASSLNVSASGDAASGEVVKGNDTRLSDARTPTTHSHTTSDVTGLQGSLDGKQPLATVLTNTTASFTTTLETKLNGIATGATVNSSDATLLSRANHTGTQLASTISDFNTAADARVVAGIAGKEDTITAGTTAQYWRGDKSWQTLDSTTVGLSNVNNTSDANKPVSTATQTALNLKYDASNPSGYITRTVVSTSGAATLPNTANTDYIVFITGAHNQTLPSAVSNTNKYDIKNTHTSGVTISTTSSQTIDGDLTIVLPPLGAVTLISNGSNWSIF